DGIVRRRVPLLELRERQALVAVAVGHQNDRVVPFFAALALFVRQLEQGLPERAVNRRASIWLERPDKVGNVLSRFGVFFRRRSHWEESRGLWLASERDDSDIFPVLKSRKTLRRDRRSGGEQADRFFQAVDPGAFHRP